MAIFDKIILCASASQLTLGMWRLGKLKHLQIYQNDRQGYEAFGHFLAQNRQINLYMLVDGFEEDYHLESLPHTRGSDRRALVERKLNQICRGADFRTALFLNREMTKQKTDRFLFIALHHAEFLEGWLKVIEGQQAALAGVHLFSMVSKALVKQANLIAPHILLCENLSTGLRQTYLQNGHLHISRLVAYPSGVSSELKNVPPYFYLAEIEKARLYLISQRLVTADDEIELVMPAADDQTKALCEQISQFQKIKCKSLNLQKISNRMNLNAALITKYPEILHMNLLAKSASLDSLATGSLLKHYQIHKVRKWLNFFSASILLVGILLSAYYVVEDLDQKAKITMLADETLIQSNQYQQVAKDFPTTPYPSSDLQRVVALQQTLRQYQGMPDRMMQVVSEALFSAPEIQINRLNWVQANDANLKDNEGGVALTHSNEVKVTNAGLAWPNGTLYEISFLDGEIKRFNGDYRAALSSVSELAERLKLDVNVAYVEILQAPVNLSSYSSLEGSTTDQVEVKQSSALFKLKLILKPAQLKP